MKLFIYRGKVESESKMQAELIKRCLRVYILENCMVNEKVNDAIKTLENTAKPVISRVFYCFYIF